MASVNDVVTLSDGSTGVIGEAVSGGYRLYFIDSYLDISESDISTVLSAPSFSVADEITVWPYLGTITAIDGDDFTVAVDRQEDLGFGPITWTGTHVVPRWRVIKDNDSRIERIW